MSKKVKSLLLVLCALVFAVAGVFATLAYLQDNGVVENTVTIGDIDIILDEGTHNGINNITGEVDFDADERVYANEYHLIPAITYEKDPTVHVKETSEPCYIFIRVQNDLADIEVNVEDGVASKIADQIKANGWEELPDYADATSKVYIYNAEDLANDYIFIASDNDDGVEDFHDLVIFEQFKIDPDAENAVMLTYAEANVIVKAAAIQTVGFNGDIDAAYAQIADHLAIN